MNAPNTVLPNQPVDQCVAVLNDGVVVRMTPGVNAEFAVCVGARIAVVDSSSGQLNITGYIPMPPGGMERLQLSTKALYAFARGNLQVWRRESEGAWKNTSLRLRDKVIDLVVIDDWMYQLQPGRLLAIRLTDESIAGEELKIDVPSGAKHLRSISPYIAVFGPSILWLASIENNQLRCIYVAGDRHPFTVTLAGGESEILVADHLTGLFTLTHLATGDLALSGHDGNILHPYAIAKAGDGWLVANERGLAWWNKGTAARMEISSDPVVELYAAGNGYVVASQSNRILLLQEQRVISRLELPGYAYSSATASNIVITAAENGLYMFSTTGDFVDYLPVPGSPRAVVICHQIAYVATTNGLFSFDLQRSQMKMLCSRECSGEPVSLAADSSGDYAYWSSGLYLRKVKVGPSGAMRIVSDHNLGVYPHRIVTSQERVYMACGDGGFLWRYSSQLEQTTSVHQLLFAADVAANGQYIAIAAAKSLIILADQPNSTPSIVARLDDQRDLCTCAFDEETLIFATGKRLCQAIVEPDCGIHIVETLQLPFTPRHLNATQGIVLVSGIGGTLILNRRSKETWNVIEEGFNAR